MVLTGKMLMRATMPLRLRGASASAAVTARSRGISTRVAAIGNNVFAEISLLAAQHGAVNLGQGFPSFHTPEYVQSIGGLVSRTRYTSLLCHCVCCAHGSLYCLCDFELCIVANTRDVSHHWCTVLE
jgi:hypothetical protein